MAPPPEGSLDIDAVAYWVKLQYLRPAQFELIVDPRIED
jgi:hypothetical protein